MSSTAWERKFEAFMMKDINFGPYYWEDKAVLPWWRKCAQVSLFVTEKSLRGAEFVGEVVAKVFGIDDSEYQWVLDAQEDAQEDSPEDSAPEEDSPAPEDEENR